MRGSDLALIKILWIAMWWLLFHRRSQILFIWYILHIDRKHYIYTVVQFTVYHNLTVRHYMLYHHLVYLVGIIWWHFFLFICFFLPKQINKSQKCKKTDDVKIMILIVAEQCSEYCKLRCQWILEQHKTFVDASIWWQ